MKKKNQTMLLIGGLAAAYFLFLRPKPAPGSGGSIGYGGGAGDFLQLEALRDALWLRLPGDQSLDLRNVHGGDDESAVSADADADAGTSGVLPISPRTLIGDFTRIIGDTFTGGDGTVFGGRPVYGAAADAEVYPVDTGLNATEQVLKRRRDLAYGRLEDESYNLVNVHGGGDALAVIQAHRDRLYASVADSSNDLTNVHGGTPAPLPPNKVVPPRPLPGPSNDLTNVHGGGPSAPTPPPPPKKPVPIHEDLRGPRGG